MPRSSPYRITLTDEERQTLEANARAYTSPYCDVVRAKIVLLAAQGLRNDEIAARLDTPRQIVSKWRKRFHEQRLAGLTDLPRGGRPPACHTSGGSWLRLPGRRAVCSQPIGPAASHALPVASSLETPTGGRQPRRVGGRQIVGRLAQRDGRQRRQRDAFSRWRARAAS